MNALMLARMTQFWGRLFLINFAMGVVTGIVMEFQFGMNWSSYSRFVGDIFGAPLVGYTMHNGSAEMTNFFALLGNPNVWVQYPHVGPECQSRARVMVEK